MKTYAYIGKWGRDIKKLGFGIYEFDPQTAAFRYIKDSKEEDIHVGYTVLDQDRNILYCVDETTDYPGMKGGGGRIFAFKLDPENGDMNLINAVPALGVNTSSLILDKDKKYLVVTNHAGRVPITVTEKDENGDLRVALKYDEPNTVLFRLREDGGIDKPVDVFKHTIKGPHPNQNCAHPHQVAMSPDGRFFIVCDKGGDTVYVFTIDRENEKLVLTGDAPYRDLPGSSPRYGVFHEDRPFYFMNHETRPLIHSFRYDENGCLEVLDTQNFLPDDFVMPEKIPDKGFAEASDIRLSKDGKVLYNIVRNPDLMVVFDVDTESGKLAKIQTIPLTKDGEKAMCRGCAFTPDRKYVVIPLMAAKKVIAMPVLENGHLGDSFTVLDGLEAAANVTFWEC